VLAASPVLFTAHYRSVVPAHNTPNILALNFSKFGAAIMSFCTSAPSVGNSLQPFFLFAVLNASPRNQSLFPRRNRVHFFNTA